VRDSNYKQEELISVIVVSYNSSNYILDTLNSVKDQSYHAIELIITDDGSKDDTIDKVKLWLENNDFKSNLKRLILVSSIQNTGVSCNCNRGLSYAQGTFIKFIAGDDILTPDCISDNMRFIKDNQDSLVLTSQVEYINEDGINTLTYDLIQEKMKLLSDASPSQQYRELLYKGNYFLGCAYFIKRELLNSFGGFDETIRLVEDYPLFLKLTLHNIKIYYLPTVTVKYRLHPSSLSSISNTSDKAFHECFTKDMCTIYKKYRRNHIKKWTLKFDLSLDIFIKDTVITLGNKRIVYRVLRLIKLISPLTTIKLYLKIREKLVNFKF